MDEMGKINEITNLTNKLDYLAIQLDKIDKDLKDYRSKQDERLMSLEKEFYNVKGQFRIAITGGAVFLTLLNLIFQFVMKGMQ